jgi:hypothetical protein
MSRFSIALAALILLAGCSREPLSSHYFDSHPAELDRTLQACAEGSVRGRECDNADLAKANRDRAARMKMYRSGFEGR